MQPVVQCDADGGHCQRAEQAGPGVLGLERGHARCDEVGDGRLVSHVDVQRPGIQGFRGPGECRQFPYLFLDLGETVRELVKRADDRIGRGQVRGLVSQRGGDALQPERIHALGDGVFLGIEVAKEGRPPDGGRVGDAVHGCPGQADAGHKFRGGRGDTLPGSRALSFGQRCAGRCRHSSNRFARIGSVWVRHSLSMRL